MDKISIVWGIEDVKAVAPKLTDAQCREVLQTAERQHDASVGINWDVLKFHAENI